MNKHLHTSGILIFTLFLTACNGPFSDYNNLDLKKEFSKCDYSRLSPAGAQRCNNIKKECELRKEESGFRC